MYYEFEQSGDTYVGKEGLEGFFDDGEENGWYDILVMSKNSDGTYECDFVDFEGDNEILNADQIRVKASSSVTNILDFNFIFSLQ